MAINDPPTNVGALLVRVKQSISNINQHRAVMAQVAQQAKTATPTEPKEGVNK